MSGELQQSPDELVNQVHHNSVPVLRTDPQAYVVNDGTFDRVMIGGFGDGNYGLKVSQSGQDVKTATSSQLVMSSAFNSFKIVSSGTASIVVPNPPTATVYETTITHGLGFAPAHLVYVISGPNISQTAPLPFESVNLTTPLGIVLLLRSLVDSSKLYIDINSGTTSATYAGTYTFRYYLLQETAGS